MDTKDPKDPKDLKDLKDPKDLQPNIIYLLHNCCNDGYKMILDYIRINPTAIVKDIGLFNVRDMKLAEKYNFDFNDLYQYSFLVDNEKIIERRKNNE